MIDPQTETEMQLFRLCSLTSSEFSAVALIDSSDGLIRWVYAHGNSNERFKQIVQRKGRGLAGLALRSGRTAAFHPSVRMMELKDDPIMIAERLLSAIVVPAKIDDEIECILLVGRRTDQAFLTHERELIENVAQELARLVKLK